MKKFITILFIAVCANAFAQTNPITAINISLPANPDANVANWGTGTSLLVISATAKSANGRIDPHIEESRILVIIKRNGKKVCGDYISSSAPQADFNTATKVWSGGNAASFLGKGVILQPGNYELSVQFFGNGAAGPIPLSDEKIKPFTIKGNDQQAYQLPQLIVPADGTAFKEEDIKKPIIFRWTPVIPKPQEPVTYRLRVWQLMQGQTGAQAIRVNQPIIIKDADNITQANITNIADGPCKPPLMCAFVWNIQALNKEGKPIGPNNGVGEALAFTVTGNTAKGLISNPNLHQNPGYLTGVDNKDKPASPVAPGKQKNEDANSAMSAVSTTRMAVAAGQVTSGKAITGIDITLLKTPDANTANWVTGVDGGWATNQQDVFIITTISRPVNGRIDPGIEESRILLFIKKDGKKVCGVYTGSTAPVAGLKKTKTIGQLSTGPSASVADFLGQACILEPGDYKLSIQFFDNNYRKITPLSDEMVKSFTIKAGAGTVDAPAQQIDIEKGALKQNPGGYLTTLDNKDRPSSIIYDGTVELKQGGSKPVFHWKASGPLPDQPYSIKIVEITGDQSPEDAIETNTPVLEGKALTFTGKDTVPAYQFFKAIDPGKKYAWNVTVWDKNGKQISRTRGVALSVTN